MSVVVLISLGVLVGAFGTLIGAGGGFILVPILLILYPEKQPELITGISLAVVFLNAASGTIAYGFKKRVDYKSALLFSATTLPGAIIGSMLTSSISRPVFNLVFGILLLIISSLLLFKPSRPNESGQHLSAIYFMPTLRKLTDKYGKKYAYRYDIIIAGILSFFVGIVSSLMGIGGGIIHVPAMVSLLNFPVHIATATSHFVLAVMGLSGSAVHWISGDLQENMGLVLYLGIGVITGAQIGAAFSHKVNERQIIRSLAVALLLVAGRILWMVVKN